MPRKGSPYGRAHVRARDAQLLREPWCTYCLAEGRRRWATVADHVPPVSTHRETHRDEADCCRYVSSCKPHSDLQGGLIRAGKALPQVDEFTPAPEPVGFELEHPVWSQASWLDELRVVPENATWPRLMTLPHPDAVGSHGSHFVEWCRDVYGVDLRWWQRLVAYRLLEVNEANEYVWRVCALSMARQMGKSTLLCALMLWRLTMGRDMFGERQTILHVAKDVATARDTQMDARLWAEVRPDEYDVKVANGKECIMHRDSISRWLIKAEWAAKGLSPTAALVDECWDVQSAVVENHIRPSLISHKQPWLLLTSTAADDEEATTLFPDIRATLGLKLDDPDRELYIEWSAPRDADLEDRDAWRLASPHWDANREREIADYVEKALQLGGKRIDGVRAEWFNIWPLTTTVGKGEELVHSESWMALADPDVEAVGPWVVAVEDCFGRGAAACAAGLAEDGRIVVGGFAFESRSEAYSQAASWLSMSSGSTLLVGALLRDDPELADLGLAESRGTSETRSALSLLRELVAAGRVAHDGSDVSGQVGRARVLLAPSGGLQLVNLDRFDVVRAAVWAVAEAYRAADLVSMVHGGPLPQRGD